MKNIFNSIVNTLIRNVDYRIRVIIAICFFALALFTLIWSIRKKNDKHPIAWGWMILCIFSIVMSVLYVAL